jgi:N-acetylmuramoyl-L-alanine amidase
MMRLLRLLALLALAFPAAAQAEATIVSRDVPLAGERAPAAQQPKRFNLVGLHWRGPGHVEFRTRSLGGRWSGWRDAAPEAEDLPDARTAERSRRGSWRLGNPWWVGSSDRIEYRLRGRVTRLRAFFVWSETAAAVPARTLQRASSPTIVPRLGWKANEAIRRSEPSYASAVRYSVVHHTAGSNSYTAAESGAIVRAIQTYHVKGNGWNDIGYNFLVDKYGQVFEGRYGGIERNVVGAHAEGFNTGSVGVAVLGEYSSLAVTAKAREALARLLAWRLDVAHVDPLTTLSVPSGGNARFPSGIPVFLRAVSGHRDTGFTDCPGTALYNLLNGIAGEVGGIGLPKLYAPVVTGAVPGLVRFRARLSSALDWTVDVADPAGVVVASGAGFGANVDWTWDATLATPAAYRYTIRAGTNVLPASGTLGGGTGPAAPLQVTGVAADPETVTPNGDGVADVATITYTLSDAATVTATVLDGNRTPVATLLRAWKRAAEHTLAFDAAGLPDGLYTVSLEAKATGGRIALTEVQVAVTRTLGGVGITRVAFSPNRDGTADTIGFRFSLAAPADVRLRVLKDGKWVVTPLAASLPPGAQRVAWDGTKRIGRLLDGAYEAVLEATDTLATARVSLPFVSDTRAPKVTIVKRNPLRIEVSEPARLTLRVGGRSHVHDAKAAGVVVVRNVSRRGGVRVVAWDTAGNRSRPVSRK